MIRARRTAAVLFGIAAVACAGQGGIRPRIEPFAGSRAQSVEAPSRVVLGAIAEEVRAAGLPVAVMTAVEGYLETGWFDATTLRPRTPRAGGLEGMVRLRFFADPVAGRTRLVAECVHRTIVDPSLPERELEQLVSDGHPGLAVTDSILTRVAARFPPVPRSPAPPRRN